MRITYDRQTDFAYIYLVDRISPGDVGETVELEAAPRGMINLDFDREGRLLGIEVGRARASLHPDYFDPGGEEGR